MKAVMDFLAHGVAFGDLTRKHPEQTVVIKIGPVIHDEAEIGLLRTPFDRSANVLRVVIPQPNRAAVECRCYSYRAMQLSAMVERP